MKKNLLSTIHFSDTIKVSIYDNLEIGFSKLQL